MNSGKVTPLQHTNPENILLTLLTTDSYFLTTFLQSENIIPPPETIAYTFSHCTEYFYYVSAQIVPKVKIHLMFLETT